jgi:electron-transferring-flavoprotein dehydrogenase
VPKIKGTHLAMKSGMVAAEAAFDALAAEDEHPSMEAYAERLKTTWLWDELYRVRNIRGSFRAGLFPALAYSALETYVFRGRAPWTVPHHGPDHASLKKASESRRIEYPRPDGKITFDKLSSVFLSNTNHEEDQPSHLVLKDPTLPQRVNLPDYDGPEQRYCPAGVYEYVARRDRRRAAAPDQRAELRPLQDVRHQGSGAEHRVGHAPGRRRAELPRGDVGACSRRRPA